VPQGAKHVRNIDVSVVIPTYLRPKGLRRAVASVLAQTGVEATIEVVIVDNDPEGSAEAFVTGLASEAAVPVRYVAEPRRGISHARNSGVAAAAGHYVAFIDDDVQVDTGWLAAHLRTLHDSGADAAVGPVYPVFPPAVVVHPFCRKIYTRDAHVPSGASLPVWSTANCIFIKARCFSDDTPFDPRLGLTGGEDTVYLRQLTRSGHQLVWCSEAIGHETIPAERLEPHYVVRRMFRGAQTTTYACTAVRPRELLQAVRHMAVGAAQLIFWAPMALVLRLKPNGDWLPATAKAAAGLGKLLWHPRLQPRLYR
jgi:succinoglycan biosynthesis protein ExoM